MHLRTFLFILASVTMTCDYNRGKVASAAVGLWLSRSVLMELDYGSLGLNKVDS